MDGASGRGGESSARRESVRVRARDGSKRKPEDESPGWNEAEFLGDFFVAVDAFAIDVGTIVMLVEGALDVVFKVADFFLDVAPSVLGLAFSLVGCAFGFQIRIAGCFADTALNLAAEVLQCALDVVRVHASLPVLPVVILRLFRPRSCVRRSAGRPAR